MVVTFWPTTEPIGVMQLRAGAFDMNRAGAAKAHAAAKLGAVVTGHVANRPEQRHILGDIEWMVLTVEFQVIMGTPA